jgi:ubiquinone/menaquinone biosynthesis C-methylase UbiE
MAQRVCPVWIGYLLASPIRKLVENPRKILSPYIKKGMKVLDIGCAMGFFSLPIAEMVGSDGKVTCVDLQQKMIESLIKRAKKAGLSNRIETRICRDNSLSLDDLKEEIDFAVAFHIVHEVPDINGFFSQIYKTIKPDGRLFVTEPIRHVSKKDFDATIFAAQQNGFEIIDSPEIRRVYAVVFGKKKTS